MTMTLGSLSPFGLRARGALVADCWRNQSNPRYVSVYTLSRRAPSTTRTPHRRSLPQITARREFDLMGGGAAHRVDLQAAAAQEVDGHTQRLRRAMLLDVTEDPLGTFLVKTLVIAEGNQVAQQAGMIDPLPRVM